MTAAAPTEAAPTRASLLLLTRASLSRTALQTSYPPGLGHATPDTGFACVPDIPANSHKTLRTRVATVQLSPAGDKALAVRNPRVTAGEAAVAGRSPGP